MILDAQEGWWVPIARMRPQSRPVHVSPLVPPDRVFSMGHAIVAHPLVADRLARPDDFGTFVRLVVERIRWRIDASVQPAIDRLDAAMEGRR